MYSRKMTQMAFRAVSKRISLVRSRIKKPGVSSIETAIGTLSRSHLFSDVSHAVRTPMNGILGMLELLQDSGLNAEQSEFTHAAKASAEELFSLINNILDLSLSQAGSINQQNISFDLEHELTTTLSTLKENVKFKNVDLVAHYALTTQTQLIGDPDRIKQVVINLVNHATKLTADGQVHITIETTMGKAGNCRLRVSVVDTNPTHAKNFSEAANKFDRPGMPSVREFDSTELGLTLSKNLIELMGGELSVDNQQGHRNTFWFTLELPQAPSPLATVRVLFVDDQPNQRLALQEQLAAHKIRADGFDTAAEALDALGKAASEKDPYRIAILDHQMRGIDGELFGAAMKSDPAYRDTLLILLSSIDEKEAPRFAAAGFSGFISKPLTAQNLLHTLAFICSALNRHENPVFLTNGVPATTAESHPSFNGCRILIAEDDLINQRVATRMLEKLDCQVDVAENGQQAVSMHHVNKYDLILMDCQMPVLDGHQATRQIRALETGKQHTPVIAWTAHATYEEKMKCMAAGMDDFLTKPLRPSALRHALGRWLHTETGSDAGSDAIEENDELESVQEMFNDDFPELVALFQHDSPKRIVALHVALAEDDALQIAKVAHTLGGSTASIGAKGLSAMCRDLEVRATQGMPEDIESRLETIEKEYARIDEKLRSMVSHATA